MHSRIIVDIASEDAALKNFNTWQFFSLRTNINLSHVKLIYKKAYTILGEKNRQLSANEEVLAVLQQVDSNAHFPPMEVLKFPHEEFSNHIDVTYHKLLSQSLLDTVYFAIDLNTVFVSLYVHDAVSL